MRIDLNTRTPELPENKGTARPGATQRATPGERGSGTDQARLAGQARIRELQAQAEQLPDDRASKVEALTRAIQRGEYNVSSDQIAEALLSQMSARSVLVG